MKSTFPEWIYDGSEIADPFGYGERAVRFLRALRHPKNPAPGNPFQLDPWQERIVRRIYGPRHPDGTRIVRTVVLLLPRGNRKTSLCAALALLHTLGPERLPGGEVVSAASDRNQAKIAFREAMGIITADPRISDPRVTRLQPYQHTLVSAKHRTVYRAVSCDAARQHGGTPSFVLADELHAWKKRDLWDVLRSGLVKTPGSLLMVATTAGRGQDNVAWEIVDDARKVARGEVNDPSILPILFEADRNCDWTDEAVWRRVNPGLAHGYPDLEGLRQLAREGQRKVGDREALRQLNLNIWLDHSADPFVDMDVYDAGGSPVDLDALKDQPCWLAVDLSSTTDLSVIVGCWRIEDGGYFVKAWFFCPAETVRTRDDASGATYGDWVEREFVTATDGTVIDYQAIEDRIVELCDEFNVREIAFDPYMARQVQPKLLDMGLPVVDFRQVPSLMMPAIHELERAVLGGEFRHDGNPVLRHCFANVVVKRNDQGHIAKFTKSRLWLSIDGAVAAAMAVARASAEGGGSVYDDPEFDPAMMVC